jgi:hypothetical protein
MLLTELQVELESLILEVCHSVLDAFGMDDDDLPENFALELAGSALRKLIADGYLRD